MVAISLPFPFSSILFYSFSPIHFESCFACLPLSLYLPSLFVDLLFIEKLKVQADDKFLSLASFPLFSQLPSFFFSLLTSFSLPLFSLGIFHCVFGDLQESLSSACREVLDTAAQEKDRTFVFWMNGFVAVSNEWRVIILEMV